MKIQQIMSDNQKHWSSKALILFGMWLWKQGEYGHALLCIHAPQWGLKIGTQLSITWEDVIHNDEDLKGMSKHELWLPNKETTLRPISKYIGDSLEVAYHNLPISEYEDFVYKNYKTGKPLTSSTLNRELQRFSQKFEAEIKEKTGANLEFRPIKTNAFEIAWALDMVKKYNYSKQVFSAVSNFMGHRTVKDTINLLEVEPNDKITFDFEMVGKLPDFREFENIDLRADLSKFIGSRLVESSHGKGFHEFI